MQDWYKFHKSINAIHHINEMKDKSHTIISIDAGKAFDKIQHSFMIKTLSKVEIEGTYPNIIKAIYDDPTGQQHTQWAKTTTIPLKIGNGTAMSALTSCIQHNTGSPSHRNQTRRRNKRHPNWIERSKTIFI